MKKRYVHRNGKLVEDVKVQRRNFHNIQPDIKPYWSVASNRMIGSRSSRREDLKVTGCREVDPSEKKDFMRDRSNEHQDIQFDDKDIYDINKILDRGGYH